MSIIPQILEVTRIAGFQITCIWNTGEIRRNDFAPQLPVFLEPGNFTPLQRLAEPETFSTVEVLDGTLAWPTVVVEIQTRIRTSWQPLALDPVVLYESSEFQGYSLRPRLGYFLREARLAAGLTQQALAERCATSKTYISRIESGRADFQVSTIERIFEQGLGKSLDIRTI